VHVEVLAIFSAMAADLFNRLGFGGSSGLSRSVHTKVRQLLLAESLTGSVRESLLDVGVVSQSCMQ
jgi:hypothetical protein